MNKLLAGIALAATLAPGAQAAPSQYLCIPEHSAGLHYDMQAGAWGPQTFATNRKYILRQLTDNDWDNNKKLRMRYFNELDKNIKPAWGFFDVGDTKLQATCGNADFGIFVCHSLGGELKFDLDFRRFEISFEGAYATQLPLVPGEQPDDLLFEIGTCSPF